MVNLRLKMIREQRVGVFLLMIFILLAEVILHRDLFKEDEIEIQELPINWGNLKPDLNDYQRVKSDFKPFNPNLLSKDQWIDLGFSERQAEVILKYKKMLGGSFTSKLQLKECFAISDDKYREMEPFLLMNSNHISVQTETKFVRNKLKKFNPNTLDKSGWISLGFTEKQTDVILKFKKTLGGTFSSKEQIEKCFVISKDKYQELASFILLPEKSKEDIANSIHSSKNHMLVPFNPNLYTSDDWQKIGFSKKQAEVILKYKNKLGGNFTSKYQIKECYVISEYKYNEIEPYIQF